MSEAQCSSIIWGLFLASFFLTTQGKNLRVQPDEVPRQPSAVGVASGPWGAPALTGHPFVFADESYWFILTNRMIGWMYIWFTLWFIVIYAWIFREIETYMPSNDHQSIEILPAKGWAKDHVIMRIPNWTDPVPNRIYRPSSGAFEDCRDWGHHGFYMFTHW